MKAFAWLTQGIILMLGVGLQLFILSDEYWLGPDSRYWLQYWSQNYLMICLGIALMLTLYSVVLLFKERVFSNASLFIQSVALAYSIFGYDRYCGRPMDFRALEHNYIIVYWIVFVVLALAEKGWNIYAGRGKKQSF